MAKSREIKQRMKAVGNIRRITRTMQMIATSKFARAQQAAIAGRPYTDAVLSLVSELAGVEGADHPLLTGVGAGSNRPELTLVLTSDRGLCGPYNSSIIRTALPHLRQNRLASDGRIEVVGKKGLGVFRFNGIEVSRHLAHLSESPKRDEIGRLADEYIRLFAAGEVSAIRVVYMKYISAGRQSPETLQLLPFEPPAADQERTGVHPMFEFSPNEGELLAEVLPAAVRTVLFQCFNDAVVSEHVARMVAMQAATDNAAKMGRSLQRQFNRARQAQITTELSEIISGSAALE